MSEHEHESPAPASQTNLNTYILGIGVAIIMATLGWNGSKTSENNDTLKTISATLPFVQESIKRVEGQVGNLVTRSEHLSDINQIKADIARITAEQERLRDAAAQPRRL